MIDRLNVHQMLVDVSGIDNIYFQPPENIKLKYPAIIYSIDDIDNRFAGNKVYNQERAYQIIVVDKDPDSIIVDDISTMDGIAFVRSYISDNIYHTVFKKYF